MNLKQHNDIVQKLMKKLNSQESEITKLQKQLNKAHNPQQVPKLAPSQQENRLNKKINNLNKEHKQRISQLTQQLRSKSNENKQLKERLNLKKNQQAKQQEHVSEIMKKNGVIGSYDHKFASVVSQYESQIQKKNKHIESLQKQIKQNYFNAEQRKQVSDENSVENLLVNQVQPKCNETLKQKQQEIKLLKSELNKYKRLYEERASEYKDMAKKYAELTRDYYKIVNQYGYQDVPLSQSKKTKTQSNPKLNNKKISGSAVERFQRSTGIQNILEQMVEQCENEEQESLAYSIETDLDNYLNKQPNTKKRNLTEIELSKVEHIIEQVLGILGIDNRTQIVSNLTRMKAKLQDMTVCEESCRFLQQFLYRMGMGKVQMSMITKQLGKLQKKVNRMAQNSDLLDEVCLEVGAKRERVLQKIKDLKITQQQFFSNMKNVKFMHELPRANKITEFIDYFELDKEICELPDQLKRLYEQLKYVEKFMKQSNLILQRQSKGLQQCLEGILRFLERKKAEESLDAIQKLQKMKVKKRTNQ